MVSLFDVLTRLVLSPGRASAAFDTFHVSSWGFGTLDWGDILTNIESVLLYSIPFIATAVFIVGAFNFTIAAGNEERKSFGRDLMFGSLIGLAIVFGAQLILRAVSFFLWG